MIQISHRSSVIISKTYKFNSNFKNKKNKWLNFFEINNTKIIWLNIRHAKHNLNELIDILILECWAALLLLSSSEIMTRHIQMRCWKPCIKEIDWDKIGILREKYWLCLLTTLLPRLLLIWVRETQFRIALPIHCWWKMNYYVID